MKTSFLFHNVLKGHMQQRSEQKINFDLIFFSSAKFCISSLKFSDLLYYFLIALEWNIGVWIEGRRMFFFPKVMFLSLALKFKSN